MKFEKIGTFGVRIVAGQSSAESWYVDKAFIATNGQQDSERFGRCLADCIEKAGVARHSHLLAACVAYLFEEKEEFPGEPLQEFIDAAQRLVDFWNELDGDMIEEEESTSAYQSEPMVASGDVESL